MSEEPNETPVWRILLSVLVTIIVFIRLFMTCSNSRNRTSTTHNDYGIEQFRNELQQGRMAEREALKTKSNDIFYTKYAELDKFGQDKKERYKISKITNDTLVGFGFGSQIKIFKNNYYQNNHDDSLKMAIKMPDGFTVFIHDFKSMGPLEDNFKKLKYHSQLKDFKFEEPIGKFKAMSYSITKNNTRFNGYTLGFESDNYLMFFEFEGEKIKKNELRIRALMFLMENVVGEKRISP